MSVGTLRRGSQGAAPVHCEVPDVPNHDVVAVCSVTDELDQRITVRRDLGVVNVSVRNEAEQAFLFRASEE